MEKESENNIEELKFQLLEKKLELNFNKKISDRNWQLFAGTLAILTIMITFLGILFGISIFKGYQTDKEARDIQKEARTILSDAHENAKGISTETRKLIEDTKNDIKEKSKKSDEILSQTNGKMKLAAGELDKITVQRKEAEEFAKKAKESEDSTRRLLAATVYFFRGQFAYEQDQKSQYFLEKELKNFDKATEYAPGFLDAQNAKGNVLIYLGRYAEAIETLEFALKFKNDDNEEFRYMKSNLAWALKKRNLGKDNERAMKIFAELIKEEGNDVPAIFAYALTGRKAEMIEHLNLLIKKDANNRNLKDEKELEQYQNDPDFKALF